MAALGPCGDLSSSTYIVMNELTTIGAAAALSNFMNGYASVGSGSSDTAQLQTAFLTANEYTNTTSGSVPGATLPTFFSASSTALQTLADIVASCVNSAGGVAEDSSACGQLFGLATISGNAAPTDTVGAILNILKQPTVNVSQLFYLIPPQPPFTSTLPGAPASWALPITSNATPQLTYTLYAFPEADNSVTPLYALINNAQSHHRHDHVRVAGHHFLRRSGRSLQPWGQSPRHSFLQREEQQLLRLFPAQWGRQQLQRRLFKHRLHQHPPEDHHHRRHHHCHHVAQPANAVLLHHARLRPASKTISSTSPPSRPRSTRTTLPALPAAAPREPATTTTSQAPATILSGAQPPRRPICSRSSTTPLRRFWSRTKR